MDFQPGVPAFSAAIRACCEKVKQWCHGLLLLEEIKDVEWRPSSFLALRLPLEKPQERKLVPDAEAFRWALSGCAKVGLSFDFRCGS